MIAIASSFECFDFDKLPQSQSFRQLSVSVTDALHRLILSSIS
jgi:hypothetical protein